MKFSKHTLVPILLLVLIAALYRAIPGRPWGFAPQFAMAVFGGAIIKDRKLAFLLPLASLLISDLLYELLYTYGFTEIRGFYKGMFENYLIFGSLTTIGFFVQANKVSSIAGGLLAAPTAFFFVSNLLTWAGNGGYQRPMTFSGLVTAYIDGLPFYANSIIASLVFGVVLFVGNYLLGRSFRLNEAS